MDSDALEEGMPTACDLPDNTLVLVTGASGFVATHIISQLLNRGIAVRGTVRNRKKCSAFFERLWHTHGDLLSLVDADLSSPDGWLDAVTGCTYVLHVASPVVSDPKSDNEVIGPAVDGTLHVLRACAAAKSVRRVVLTGSIVSVVGMPPRSRSRRAADTDNEQGDGKGTFTDADWTDLEVKQLDAYAKSKTLAERAAWDFVDQRKADELCQSVFCIRTATGESVFELSVILPSMILGPVISGASCASVETVRKILMRQVPVIPRLCMPSVDVRDVAAAHIAAMTAPHAAGRRFIAASRELSLREIAQFVYAELKPYDYKPYRFVGPTPLFRFAAVFSRELRPALRFIDVDASCDNTAGEESISSR